MYPWIPWESVVHPCSTLWEPLVQKISVFSKSILSTLYRQAFREMQDIEIVEKKNIKLRETGVRE